MTLITTSFAALIVLACLQARAQDPAFQWAVQTPNPATSTLMTVDREGNTILAAAVSSGTAMTKLSPAGSVLWSSRNGLPIGGAALRTDAAGAIFVAGSAFTFQNWSDPPRNDMEAGGVSTTGTGGAYLAKVSPDGKLEWVRLSGESPSVFASALALGDSGNLYLAGHYYGGVARFGETVLPAASAGSGRLFMVKFDSGGHVRWAHSLPGGSIVSIAADASENLHCAGGSKISSFNSAGELRWEAELPKGARASGVAVDREGAVFVAHTAHTALNAGVGVAKFSGAGSLLWARQGTTIDATTVPALAVDADGNCVLAGAYLEDDLLFGDEQLSTVARWEMFAAKFSSSGDLRWLVQSTGEDAAGNGTNTRISETMLGLGRGGVAATPQGGFVLAGTFRGTVSFGSTSLIGPDYGATPLLFAAYLSDDDFKPAAPSLNIERVPDGLVLRWVGASSGYVLESTDRLGPSATWAPHEPPSVEGDNNTVTFRSTSAPQFFRLRKP
jgi:hypothetical protein